MNRRDIKLVTFPGQSVMVAAFARFTAYYESPRFRGRAFTLKDFFDAQAKPDGGECVPAWSGCNIPSRVLLAFRAGMFDPLSREEKQMLRLVADEPEPFYVTAVVRWNVPAAAHEIVHALFDLDRGYQTIVLRELRRFRLTGLRDTLLGLDYDRSVLDDEMNAYLCVGLPPDAISEDAPAAAERLCEVFARHFGFDPRGAEGRERLVRLPDVIRFPWPLPAQDP